MGDVAIKAENLGKRYQIAHARRGGHDTLREALSDLVRAPFRRRSGAAGGTSETFWALKDVGFEVRRGQAVGVIGRNGSGKSTLLKILSRITKPTTGRAEIHGRVGSLLEVGTGFHPELTGRENVFLNGAILGMRKAEIARRFDEIVAFAEVEKFIDTPVKHYSSGMYTRLAFAVAAHLEPEILIVDEVLAVGDAAFQQKCLGKMQDAAAGGRTVLFVSHNMGAVRTLTQKCLYLQAGQPRHFGATREVVDHYTHDTRQGHELSPGDLAPFRRNDNPEAAARFTAIRPASSAGVVESVPVRSSFGFDLEIQVLRRITDPVFNVVIKQESGEPVTSTLSREWGLGARLDPGRHVVRCIFKSLHLLPGRYRLDVGVTGQVGTLAWDVILDYPVLEIVNAGERALTDRPDRPGAVLCPEATWTIQDAAGTSAGPVRTAVRGM